MMSQLKLIVQLKVNEINLVDNLSMIKYVYNESIQSNKSDSRSNLFDENPLSLVCKTVMNKFDVNEKIFFDINRNNDIIELYSVDELDEIIVYRVINTLHLLIENLLFGKTKIIYSSKYCS